MEGENLLVVVDTSQVGAPNVTQDQRTQKLCGRGGRCEAPGVAFGAGALLPWPALLASDSKKGRGPGSDLNQATLPELPHLTTLEP